MSPRAPDAAETAHDDETPRPAPWVAHAITLVASLLSSATAASGTYVLTTYRVDQLERRVGAHEADTTTRIKDAQDWRAATTHRIDVLEGDQKHDRDVLDERLRGIASAIADLKATLERSNRR